MGRRGAGGREVAGPGRPSGAGAAGWGRARSPPDPPPLLLPPRGEGRGLPRRRRRGRGGEGVWGRAGGDGRPLCPSSSATCLPRAAVDSQSSGRPATPPSFPSPSLSSPSRESGGRPFSTPLFVSFSGTAVGATRTHHLVKGGGGGGGSTGRGDAFSFSKPSRCPGLRTIPTRLVTTLVSIRLACTTTSPFVPRTRRIKRWRTLPPVFRKKFRSRSSPLKKTFWAQSGGLILISTIYWKQLPFTYHSFAFYI